MHDLKTERNFYLQATWVIDVLALFFDMFSMDVCTTGRLVQENIFNQLFLLKCIVE